MKQFSIFTDGGSRGNPGEGAIGVFIIDESSIEVFKTGERIGFCTNNEAEYKAVLRGLDWIIDNKQKIEKNSKICFFLDSQLVFSQIIGTYKVKNEKMRELIFKVREKEAEIDFSIFYNYIPREKNKEADRMVNAALDNIL